MSRAPAAAARQVTARELRAMMRGWRREHASTTVWERLSDLYVWVFSAVVLGAMAINVLLQTRVVVAAECTTTTCEQARTSLVWATGLFLVAATVAALRAVGPVLVTPAAATWLLSTPVERRSVLRGRMAAAVLVAAASSSLALTAVALLAGLDAGALVVVAGAGALIGASTASLATLWQPGGRRWSGGVALLLAVVGWLWLVAIALDRIPATSSGWVGGPAGLVALGVLLVSTMALATWAASRLPALTRGDVVPGGSLLTSLSGALASLDLSLAYDVLVGRRWLRAATVRPVRGGPRGPWALAWRDVVRLRRSPGAVAALAATAVVPHVMVALRLEEVITPLSALLAFVAVLPLCSALRKTGTSPGLLRCFPMTAATVRSACLVVPAAVLGLWSLAIAPAIFSTIDEASVLDVVLVSLATGAAALAAAARWLLAPPPDYSAPLISSPAGAVPIGLLGSTLRGFDVLALATVPLVVAPTVGGALLSLALSVTVTSFVVSRR